MARPVGCNIMSCMTDEILNDKTERTALCVHTICVTLPIQDTKRIIRSSTRHRKTDSEGLNHELYN